MFSMIAQRRKFRLSAVFILVAVCGSCSKESRRRVCYPVTGQVFVRGQAAAGVLVVLYPANKLDAGAPSASGMTDEGGRFALSTYQTEDGAPAGDYEVALTWRDEGFKRREVFKKSQEPDRLKDRYKNAKTSGLRVRIEAVPNELEAFNLR